MSRRNCSYAAAVSESITWSPPQYSELNTEMQKVNIKKAAALSEQQETKLVNGKI
jgi:hypothetical protein